MDLDMPYNVSRLASAPAGEARLKSRTHAWAPLGSSLLILLALAGCASGPPSSPASRPPVNVAVAPVSTPATPAGVAPAPTATTTNPVPPPTDAGGNAGTAVSAAPSNDLFDRIRHGYALADVDSPAVDSQLAYFANHPDFLQRAFTRADPWLYYIVQQLESRGMPTELALLPMIESAFQPYAFSRARAAGMWQFIAGTGRIFGLKQDWWYDGRRDPIEGTRAAMDYLQSLHDRFNGDWLLAIAAYNCGENAVARAVSANQNAGLPIDFWNLRLPRETRAYVPKLLAMRRLVLEPARYGLEISPIPNEPYFREVATGGQVDIKIVADLAGVSVDEIYQLNPAFHRWATDPTGPHRLLVPADAAPGLQAALDQLTPDQRMRVEHYVVARGDTVSSIARQFATRPDVIRQLNGLGPTEPVVVDSSLRVPASHFQLPPDVVKAAMRVDGPVFTARRHMRRPVIRIVRRGDTLYRLARRLHTDVRTLAKLNHIRPGAKLHAGQRIKLSAGGRGHYAHYRHGRARGRHSLVAHGRHRGRRYAGSTRSRVARNG